MQMRREIGLVGLTFVGVSGVIGSGWLFAPLQAAQLAGPAAVVSWVVGGVAMFLLALSFAEVSAMLPVAGGLGRLPQFSHGKTVAMVMGWSAWVGYSATAPVEVEATLRYLGPHFPALHQSGSTDLSWLGIAVATALIVAFTLVNYYGVKLFARINTGITWVKVLIPVFVIVMLLVYFEPANFTAAGGFAPNGVAGVLGAVSSGGIIFSYIGFRHAIDLAGEARNPGFTVPAALLLSVVICFLVYGGLQLAFIGALRPTDLINGWSHLNLPGTFGPIGAVASALGLIWVARLINLGAVVGPCGGALVAVGSNARLAYALGENGFFPSRIATLSDRGVPVAALLLNLVVAVLMFVFIPFEEIVQLCGAAITLSFAVGPVVLLSLRRVDPDRPRPFRVPAAHLIAGAGFVIATLIIYWSGWETVWQLGLCLLLGMAIFVVQARRSGFAGLDLPQAGWLLPYCAGIGAASYLGTYGGIAVIPRNVDSALLVVFSLVILVVAVRRPLSREAYRRYLAEDPNIAPAAA
ncbi:APC family permease [Aquabacter spiritensis]|uniref:Amino acid/polyamine/organocation transporter (APC superfamily) n=1 Tax=Aquabacter spiritensis TaxID=933073 RepID=A0A4R3LVV7_9HYPH|nr:APC family permease [Aquabacter spiritensis]TCT04741.1 amino acid/polyamine/organocation transporter (APC superfamily) [Aquabacter spiritensis]